MTKWISTVALCCLVSCTSSRSPPGSTSGTGSTSPPTPAVPSTPGATVAGKNSGPTGLPQSSKGLRWAGTVAAGKWIWLRNMNGAIVVEGTTGSKVEVIASIRRRNNASPSGVEIKVVPHDGTFTICVVWPAQSSRCKPRGDYSHSGITEKDTEVLLTVKVPRGVAADLSTVNGSLTAGQLGAAVKAHSVNGKVTVNASGRADVASVNGRIDVTVNSGPLTASAVNGSIRARLPKQFDASLDAETINGSVNIDVAHAKLTRSSRFHTAAIIGKGGVKLKLRTVNGSVSVVN